MAEETKVGRPPAVPPVTVVERQAIDADIASLLDEDGKVDPKKLMAWKNRLRLEWAVTLKHLVRRANGRDAAALIKLGADLILSANEKPPTKEA